MLVVPALLPADKTEHGAGDDGNPEKVLDAAPDEVELRAAAPNGEAHYGRGDGKIRRSLPQPLAVAGRGQLFDPVRQRRSPGGLGFLAVRHSSSLPASGPWTTS